MQLITYAIFIYCMGIRAHNYNCAYFQTAPEIRRATLHKIFYRHIYKCMCAILTVISVKYFSCELYFEHSHCYASTFSHL